VSCGRHVHVILGELSGGDVAGARRFMSNLAKQPCSLASRSFELNPVCETMWSGPRWRDVSEPKSTQIAEPDTASTRPADRSALV
jgi:hypothetical protein